MEKKDVVCDCGRIHSIKTQKIIVEDNCFDKLIYSLLNSKRDNIVIFNSVEDCFFANNLNESLLKSNKKSYIINMFECKAKTAVAANLDDMGQNTIVAIGNEELISVAKYYAYMYECEIIIFPIGEFLDYTFSKFARLSNGVFYDFYLTVEPSEIYVDTILNSYNDLQTVYISSKYIAVFDTIVRECVYSQKDCKKSKEFLKNALYNYSKVKSLNNCELNKKNIWTLIRIGQGMSFFSQTKMFFGGDKAIVDILQAQKDEIKYLHAETIALKLVKNLYSCFFKSYPTKSTVNINKQIKELCELLKISSLNVINRLVSSDYIIGNDNILNKFNNYFPYLKAVYFKILLKMFQIESKIQTKMNFVKHYKLSHKRIERSFSLSASIYNVPCTLHLFSIFGYLDKLL